MTKTDLIKSVQQELGLPENVIQKVINATFETIKTKVAENEPVIIKEFGTFSVKQRAERQGHNIATGESLIIEAHKAPHCKFSRTFKNLLNK